MCDETSNTSPLLIVMIVASIVIFLSRLIVMPVTWLDDYSTFMFLIQTTTMKPNIHSLISIKIRARADQQQQLEP